MTHSASNSRKVTIKDVARHAGVGPMSVSVTLNGGSANVRVSEGTRAKIFEAARELGYRPNMAAQAMKSGKSRIVGVLVRNNSRVVEHERGSHPLAYDIVLGINEGLEEAGFMMSLVRLSDVDPDLHPASSAFQGHLLDGLIVVSDVPAASTARLEELVPHCVWVDSTVWRDENCIRRNEVHAGRLAAEKLLELGYRDLVCLSTHPMAHDTRPGTHYSQEQRRRGILEATREAGVTVEHCAIRTTYDAVDLQYDEKADFAKFAQRLRRDTGVIAMGYYNAYRLQLHLARHHLCPGIDFALVSCESGFSGGSAGWEDLSHVRFARFEMGQAAAHMMVELLSDTDQNTARLQRVGLASQLIQDDWVEGATATPAP